MALSNAQYESIMAEYDRRRMFAAEQLAHRRQQASKRIPALADMDSAYSKTSVDLAKAMIRGDEKMAEACRSQLADIAESRQVLLASAELPTDYLEIKYTCPICKDTGLVDGQKCECFRRMETAFLYDASNIKDLLQKENFSTFSFDYYDREGRDALTGKTSYENMLEVHDAAVEMASHFEPGKMNMLLIGPAGSGKTFISNCIAKEVIDAGYSVIYMSAASLFDKLAEETFSQGSQGNMKEMIVDCDLLVIDDLGTEMNNTFVSSQLFYCINERRLRKKSTIISTNLDLNQLRDSYSERVSSRLIESYKICRLFNSDIRLIIRQKIKH